MKKLNVNITHSKPSKAIKSDTHERMVAMQWVFIEILIDISTDALINLIFSHAPVSRFPGRKAQRQPEEILKFLEKVD